MRLHQEEFCLTPNREREFVFRLCLNIGRIPFWALMFAISVIICTRKPREDYLRRVLAALRTQSLPQNQWELLLVSVAADGPLF